MHGTFVILGNYVITLLNVRTQPYRRGHHDSGGLLCPVSKEVNIFLNLDLKFKRRNSIHE